LFNEQSFEVIKQRMLNNINLNIDKRTGSFLDSMISTIAEEVEKVYINMGDVLNLAFIEDTFDEYLDKRVSDFGLTRKIGAKSTGTVTVNGVEGTIIANGTIINTNNDLSYTVLNDITLSSYDNILYVEALEVGYKYNLLANTVFNLVDPNLNIISLTNQANFIGGIDVETDEELRERFKKVITSPPTSGNKSHYELWALECNGVGRAFVYPNTGVVQVVIVGSDNKPVSNEIVTTVKDYIDIQRPLLSGTLTVITPTILGVTIVTSIKVKNGYLVDDVKASFEDSLNTYLKTVTSELAYSKVYGILANELGVGDIVSLTVNSGTSNIAIANDKLINISSITISEVV
jgi:uncharacterized phage protein gp47/JayE